MRSLERENFDRWISECDHGKLSYDALRLIIHTYGSSSFELIISSHVSEETKRLAVVHLLSANLSKYLPIILSWLENDNARAEYAHTVLSMFSSRSSDCVFVCHALLKKLKIEKDQNTCARVVGVLIEFTRTTELWEIINESLITLKASASDKQTSVLMPLERSLFENDPYKPVPFTPFMFKRGFREIVVSSPPGTRELIIHYLHRFKPGNMMELVKLFSNPDPDNQAEIDAAIYEDLGFSYIRESLFDYLEKIGDFFFQVALKHDISPEERSLLICRGIELGGFLSAERIQKLFLFRSNEKLSDEAFASIFCSVDILKILQTENYLSAMSDLFSIEKPINISFRGYPRADSIPYDSFLTHLYQCAHFSDMNQVAGILTSKKHQEYTTALIMFLLSQMSEQGISEVHQRRRIYARFFDHEGYSSHILKLKNGRRIYRRIYERRPDLKGQVLSLFVRVPEIPNSFFLEEFMNILSNFEELNSESCLDFILYVLHQRSKHFSWIQRLYLRRSIKASIGFVKDSSLKIELEKILM